MDSSSTRRLIAKPTVSLVPSTEGMISDAMGVIQSEIIRFAAKSHKGQSLDLAESRILQGYIKCLVDLARETRERDKDSDLSSLSTEQLVAMLLSGVKEAEKEQLLHTISSLLKKTAPNDGSSTPT